MVAQVQHGEKYVFDQMERFSSKEIKANQAREIGETILQISQLVIDLASVERVPRYCPNRRENDVEHSFMVALAGIEIVSRYYPGLDSGLTGKLGLVHDFPELITDDIATFDLTDEQLSKKHSDEQAALPQLLTKLPPTLADLVIIYEEQKLPESRLIKHIDKDLPNAVNLIGAGIEVMAEDYGVYSAAKFSEKNAVLARRYKKAFPDPSHDILHGAYDLLANRFALKFNEV